MHQSDSAYHPSSVEDILTRLKRDTRFHQKTEFVGFNVALGRVLAKDVIAKEDIPHYNIAHMDGYAVDSTDIAGASATSPVTLKVKGELSLPGSNFKGSIGRGEAGPVATGGRLPEGADAIVPVENATMITAAGTAVATSRRAKGEDDNNCDMFKGSPRHGQGRLRLEEGRRKPTVASRKGRKEKAEESRLIMVQEPLPKGAFVYHAGSDAKKGELLLPKGRVLRAQDTGMLALLGMPRVPVFAMPRIAIIPTGNELTDDISETAGVADSSAGGNGIRGRRVLNSNSPVIARIIKSIGAAPHYTGIAPDNSKAIANRIRRALKTCDMAITLGGSSAGKFDRVETAINSLGKPGVIAHGTRVDRGRVTGAGIIKRKPIVVLPGPIQGATSGFIAIALPLIEGMSGSAHTRLLQVPATLTKDWQARKRFPNFMKVMYVSLLQTDGHDEGIRHFKAEPVQAESESMKVLVRADGYVMVPESTTFLPAGSSVNVRLLPGLSF